MYKGVLKDGTIVAVKKLSDVSSDALLREMQVLGKLRHRNLVRILGCVLNLDVKVLVLEYMANGNLEQYLGKQQEHANETGNMETSRLTCWEMVTRVAISIAQALAYLHHEYAHHPWRCKTQQHSARLGYGATSGRLWACKAN